jgi:hypothetical protein
MAWIGIVKAPIAWMGIVKTAKAVAGDRHNLLPCHLITTLTLVYYLDTSLRWQGSKLCLSPATAIAVLTIPIRAIDVLTIPIQAIGV